MIKLLPYILIEKYIYILPLEMATQGTDTVPIVSACFRSLYPSRSISTCHAMNINMHEHTNSRRFLVLGVGGQVVEERIS